MMLLSLLLACGLSSEGQEAAASLRRALASREPGSVSSAAREADRFRGQDPALDRMLGDALANVLMRPDEGWPLLLANPAPEDPSWVSALRGAALRSGDPARLQEAWSRTGGRALDFQQAVVEQVAARARKDPRLSPDVLEPALDRCSLMGARPMLGRQMLSAPVEGDLIGAARVLGGEVVGMGRPVLPSDVGPSAEGWMCGGLVLLEGDALPDPLPPRLVVVGTRQGEVNLFLEIREEEGTPWVFVTSNAEWGARWLRAASLYAEAGGGEAGAARVRAALGEGLVGPAFPGQAP